MMTDLTGKTALITGAGRGIGRAIAEKLSAAGMNTALLARSADQIATLAAELQNTGGNALPIPCDVSDPKQIARAVNRCQQEFGGIDALVNNAGAFLESSTADMPLEKWEYVMRVNTTAPMLLTKYVFPIMEAQKAGKIINISSTSGLQGYLYQGAYCASKHALLGYMKCVAVEARPKGIQVHNICPGGVRTGFIADSHLGNRLDGEVMIEAENVADAVEFLLRQPTNILIDDIVIKRNKV